MNNKRSSIKILGVAEDENLTSSSLNQTPNQQSQQYQLNQSQEQIQANKKVEPSVSQPQNTKPELKLVTGLEFVSQQAIDKFADEVGDWFNIPKELKHFFAYFGKLNYHSWFIDDGRKNYTFKLDDQMRGLDYLESLRVIFANNISEESLIEFLPPNLYKQTIEHFLSENNYNLDLTKFPEFGMLKELQKNERAIQSSDVYVELLHMPQRARTFYAGVIDFASTEKGFKSSERISIQKRKDDGVPILNIPSTYAAEYAAKNNVKDYTKFLKMLKD